MNAFSTQGFAERDDAGEPGATSFDNVLGGWRWRHVLNLLGQTVAAQGFRPGETDTTTGCAVIVGRMGDGEVRLALPAALVDTMFLQAPDPVRLSDLAAEDAGLLLEHLLTPWLDALEASTGLKIMLTEVRPVGALGGRPQLELESQGGRHPVFLQVGDPAARAAVVNLVAAREARGPDIPAKSRVLIGPIMMPQEAIAALQPDDEIELPGALPNALAGAVFIDAERAWPARIAADHLVLGGELMRLGAEQTARPGSLYLVAGWTAAPARPEPGLSLPLRPAGARQSVLLTEGRPIAMATLVSEPGRVTVRIGSLL